MIFFIAMHKKIFSCMVQDADSIGACDDKNQRRIIP
mgnify:CR=1 FL=1|jgi:hypothetical protein